jgi:putative nucleotidyltransferase with HDIG domain
VVENGVPGGRILVIDDDSTVRGTVAEMLRRSGYEPLQASTHEQALSLLEDLEVVLVVSDIVMPGLDGFELTELVRQRRPSLPVLLITGAGTDQNLQEALARGAAGLIAKPFSMAELARTVGAVLQRARDREDDVRRRVVSGALAGVLASVLEARDGSVRGHCDRITDLAEKIGEGLGLGCGELETLSLGALLHDIGKVGIPDSILLKPGPLDPHEWVLMKTHPEVGERLLAPFDELSEVRSIVRHHHEHWDGSGYPDALSGERIPLSARIIAVADAIEAMSVRRPYRDAMPAEEIVQQLRRGRGSQWDPVVVDCALELILSGGLEVSARGPKVLPGEAPRLWSEDELGRFAETRLADLVRMVVSLGDELSEASIGRDEPAGAAILPGRRREALSVLVALKDAIRASREAASHAARGSI